MIYNFNKINRNLAKEDDSLEQKEINDWRDRVNKKLRFWVRDDIEEIIKDKDIDRTHFHEFSEKYIEKTIRKFYSTFLDIKNYSALVISLSYNSMHYRTNLKHECIDCFFRTGDWCEYMKTIKDAVPNKEQKLFLILCDGLVYEGEIDEMFTILNESACIQEFYIVSSKFDWFIVVSDVEDSAFIYKL